MTDHDQVMFDLGLERERRREQHGFVHARPGTRLSSDVASDRSNQDTAPAGNPIATAYFRGMDDPIVGTASNSRGQLPSADVPLTPHESESALAAVVDVLRGGRPARAASSAAGGIDGSGVASRAYSETHIQFVSDRHATVFLQRNRSSWPISRTRSRRVRHSGGLYAARGVGAAVAVCNLGLENWPLKKGWRGGTALPRSTSSSITTWSMYFKSGGWFSPGRRARRGQSTSLAC